MLHALSPRLLGRLVAGRSKAIVGSFKTISMSAADQGAGPRSGESPASDMPAAAAYNSAEQVDQGQQNQQQKSEAESHSENNQQNGSAVPEAKPTGQKCTYGAQNASQ